MGPELDAAKVAKMTPEQLATALGGSLILLTESDCDVCQRSADETGQEHHLIGFRASEVTATGIYCLPCLQACCLCQLHVLAAADRLVEDEATDAAQRVPTKMEWEACAS